jgi:hypothetical protein
MFGIGAVVCIVSFFLVAVRDPSGTVLPARGWEVALSALGLPFKTWANGARLLPPAVLMLGFIAGLANPLLLAWLLLPHAKIARVLKACIVLGLLSSGGVFYAERLIPTMGFYLWAAGILLILFSSRA